jgi:type I restriction-modification system DNA methylase subunit
MPTLIDNIRRVASELGTASGSSGVDRDLSYEMAKALRWTEGVSATKSIVIEHSTIQITRGLIGPQPAAIFAVSTDDFDQSLLNNAAFYAYHASIPWGLVATRDGAMVFNSHWLRRNTWFHLPFMQWDELERNIDVFDAVTPSRIREGFTERVATRFYKPDQFLRSVDDALVERLDYWRDETLRYSKSVKNVDENLQTLFAQLFVLRAFEDRRLAQNLASLRTIYSSNGDVNLQGLRSLLQQAKDIIGSELFEVDALQHIPENVLGGIINDLYVPHNIPYPGLRYNFAWIDADILGLAYEKYLATVLAPVTPPSQLQLSLFQQPIREVERISVRKSGGVYYTPTYIVQYLTESCLNRLSDQIRSDAIPRVADFACGSGSFLVAATNSLIQRLRTYDAQRNWARELVNGKHIIGVDVDKRAVTMARLALWLRFAEEPHPLPLPRLEEIIIQGDSLSQEVWESIPDEYDAVLGNPPFLATNRTPNRDELSSRFRSAQGKYDYSYLFVELAVNHLKPHGVLGMVVPNRLFRNRDASTIREILTLETNLLTVVDFGSNEVFEGTSAYIGTIISQRHSSRFENQADSVRVINVQDLSPQFLSFFLLSANFRGEEIHSKILVAYNSSYPRGSSPWLLISPSARRIRTQLENDSEPFDEVAGIYQGIRTGANDIFIVRVESEDGVLAKIINGLGDFDIVEVSLLHPVVFGTDLQRYSVITSTRFLVYPYRNNTVLQEAEIQTSYPQTYGYLSRYRDLLADRGSIEASGLKWYELVRKRNMSWLQSPKLLIRDLATETAFSIDETGSTYLVGGTAVVPYDSDMLLPLLAYLNSKLVNQYLSQITPSFRGGFQKFEPQHLQRIPILRGIVNGSDLSLNLANQAVKAIRAQTLGNDGERREAEETIEELLYGAAGIEREELQ